MRTAQEHEQAARQAREQAGQGSGPNGDKPLFKPGRSLVWYANQVIDHGQTLLGNRYLCRGGGMFIVAPSGMGKSTLSLQMAILWCCGLVAFGIRPRKALRILIVQSEDDQGDCTEMAAMQDHLGLTTEEKQLVDQNTELVRCNDLVASRFIEALRARLQQAKDNGSPFDLVIINPYGVYLGADVKDTDACTKFLNEWLNPLLTDFEIGAILIHHTAKTNFQNTDKYSLWDWAYHGAGAACITNLARVILAIKPETQDLTVFRFIAAKRGTRIGGEWQGAFEKYFTWSSLPGVLRWEEATAEQIARASATKSAAKFADLDKVIECVPLVDPELKTTVLSRVRQKCSLGRDVAYAALNELCVTGRIFHRTIPNPKPKVRGFAAWCRTNESDEITKNEETTSQTDRVP
jgi:AAA domain-containing protein